MLPVPHTHLSYKLIAACLQWKLWLFITVYLNGLWLQWSIPPTPTQLTQLPCSGRLPVETQKQLGYNVYVFELHIKSLSTIHIRCILTAFLLLCHPHWNNRFTGTAVTHCLLDTAQSSLSSWVPGSSGSLQETCTRLGPLTWEWWEAHSAPKFLVKHS